MILFRIPKRNAIFFETKLSMLFLLIEVNGSTFTHLVKLSMTTTKNLFLPEANGKGLTRSILARDRSMSSTLRISLYVVMDILEQG